MTALLFAFLATAFAQTTHTVCQVSSSCDYDEICKAVEDAAVLPGDVLEVWSGEYEQCTISKSLTIAWDRNGDRPVIWGSGNVVYITGAAVEVTLSGFDIVPTAVRAVRVNMGATAFLDDIRVEGVGNEHPGLAIQVQNGSTAEVTDSFFDHNDAGGQNGGHFHVSGLGTLRIFDSTVSGGRASRGGGALVSGATIEVQGGVWLDNDAAGDNDGGQVAVVSSYTGAGSATFTDVEVSGGNARRGGGAFLSGSFLTINGGTWHDNHAASDNHGGHLHARFFSVVTLNEATLSGGTAQEGGAAYVSGGWLTANGGLFFGNQAGTGGSGRGGAIRGVSGAVITVQRDGDGSESIFQDNASDGYGGDIAVSTSTLEVSGAMLQGASSPNGGSINVFQSSAQLADCTFSGNTATDLGGHVRVNEAPSRVGITDTSFAMGSAAAGGSLYLLDSALSCTGCTLTDGTATDGGHIAIQGGALALTASLVQAGTASHGGGLFVSDGDNVVVTDSTFTDNIATVGGGAVGIDTAGEVRLLRNHFCGNSSSGPGGAVAVLDVAAIDASNNALWENIAAGAGGGLLVIDTPKANLTNNHFVGNAAANGEGGGAHLLNTDFDFTNNLVFDTLTGDGLVFSGADTWSVTWSAWHANAAEHVSGQITTADLVSEGSHQFVDPQLQRYVRDGGCDDLLWLDVQSLLIDAGNPASGHDDPWDSIPSAANPSDIGAWGGPQADPEAWSDADNDGYPLMWDCDPEDSTVNAETTWYEDLDADGFGDDAVAQLGCEPRTGSWVGQGGDCDPGDATVYPGAAELCDGQLNDCDGTIGAGEVDADGDGYVACDLDVAPQDWKDPSMTVHGGNDCDETDQTVHPTATELCDGQSNDCSGVLGEDEVDDDSDGYVECDIDPGGWDGADPTEGGDCNDHDAAIHPDAEEVPDNGVDEDCDGLDEVTDSSRIWDSDEEVVAAGSGCGCGSGVSPPGSVAWLLALLWIGRGRRNAGRGSEGRHTNIPA